MGEIGITRIVSSGKEGESAATTATVVTALLHAAATAEAGQQSGTQSSSSSATTSTTLLNTENGKCYSIFPFSIGDRVLFLLGGLYNVLLV